MKDSLKQKLVDLIAFSKSKNLYEVSVQEGSVKMAFKRNGDFPQPQPETAVPAPEANAKVEAELETICSPVVGRFRRNKDKNRPPLVMKGNHIKPGTKLAVVECMKIPTDVVGFCSGEIVEIFVSDGDPVEFGQPLFSVKKS